MKKRVARSDVLMLEMRKEGGKRQHRIWGIHISIAAPALLSRSSPSPECGRLPLGWLSFNVLCCHEDC